MYKIKKAKEEINKLKFFAIDCSQRFFKKYFGTEKSHIKILRPIETHAAGQALFKFGHCFSGSHNVIPAKSTENFIVIVHQDPVNCMVVTCSVCLATHVGAFLPFVLMRYLKEGSLSPVISISIITYHFPKQFSLHHCKRSCQSTFQITEWL